MTLRVLQLALVLCSGLYAAAQAPARFPLTREAVATVLTAAAGASLTSADITLPAELTATVAAPQLIPTAAQFAAPTQLRVRLNCSAARQCLPFFVTADFHTRAAALAAQQQLAARATPAPSTALATLHVGQHAILLLEDDHMRISLPVISIDAGSPGAEVRVASLDHKQIFHAVVRDANTVSGVLP